MLSPLRLSFRLGENLVEHAAVVEEALLRRLPAAELVIDGDEVHLRELRSIFCLGFRADRTVVILADDVLRLGRVEIFEIGFGELEIAVALCIRSEEHTSELQSLMRISYAVFCLKQQNHDIIYVISISHPSN